MTTQAGPASDISLMTKVVAAAWRAPRARTGRGVQRVETGCNADETGRARNGQPSPGPNLALRPRSRAQDMREFSGGVPEMRSSHSTSMPLGPLTRPLLYACARIG
jgi:hypothetical protein